MPTQDFRTHRAAAAKVRSLEKKGVYGADIGVSERQMYPGTKNTRVRKTYTVFWQSLRSNQGTIRNPRRKKAKRPPSKRISSALSRFLKRQNPAFKRASGVRVQKLKGGVIKLTPM